MRRLPVVPDSALPPVYAAWLRDVLGGEVPTEPHATCSDCAMVAAPGESQALAFDAHVKCCSHFPDLPNFLVGRILRDREPGGAAGRASTRALIRGRLGVSPLGIRAPAPRARAEDLAGQSEEFGRVPALRCPHYVDERGGLCGIWKNRNAVCVTFFCKHARGAVGSTFWREGLEPLLKAIESALARHCLLELELPAETLARLLALPERLDRVRGAELRVDDDRYHLDWGPWHSHEEELFVASAEHVARLSWDDVRRIGGAEIEARARVARHMFERHGERKLPARLRVGLLANVELGRQQTRLASYSPLDPLDLPNGLVASLTRFDGRPTRSVVREIAKKDGVEIDDELLGQLVDFQVLVDAATAAG